MVKAAPPNAQARSLFDQGEAALRAGQLPRAVELFHRAIAADRSCLALPNRIGGILLSAQAHAQAEQILQDAVARFPRDAGTLSNLGTVLAFMGKNPEALQCWSAALKIAPNFPGAHFNLAKMLTNAHRLDEAAKMFREGLARDPNQVDALIALGPLRFNLGDIVEAQECMERARRLRPGDLTPQSGLLFTSLFDDRVSWRSVVENHARWGEEFMRSLGSPAAPIHSNDRSPDRRLRVGYVSPFFRGHVNALLIEPILRAHDRANFEVFAYCVLPPEKSEEALLTSAVDHWRRCDRMTDPQLATAIQSDAIDILVDITLHMESQRLSVFARKPAPVQINYLAYPATTGLPTMDYRVTCPLLDPPGSEIPGEVEKLLRLPETFWVYPTKHPVPIGDVPSKSAKGMNPGHITFGCLNSLAKVRDACLVTWKKILDAVPNSTLMLWVKGGDQTRSVFARLATFGIEESRVKFEPTAGREVHLNRFNSIDVALDSFPYGGHTTTHDALWMGVPVIVMAGNSPVARAGECILSHVGLSNLVAKDQDEYVRLAVQCANDLPAREALRKTLRDTMIASPLCDAKRFVRFLEAGYRAAWKRWCDSLPPDHITV